MWEHGFRRDPVIGEILPELGNPFHWRVLGCVCEAESTLGGAGEILEINDASLTTYVPAAKSNVQYVRPLVDHAV